MQQYQVSTDKDSGIINDPNDWSDDPRYILDLLCRVRTCESAEARRIVVICCATLGGRELRPTGANGGRVDRGNGERCLRVGTSGK